MKTRSGPLTQIEKRMKQERDERIEEYRKQFAETGKIQHKQRVVDLT